MDGSALLLGLLVTLTGGCPSASSPLKNELFHAAAANGVASIEMDARDLLRSKRPPAGIKSLVMMSGSRAKAAQSAAARPRRLRGVPIPNSLRITTPGL